jgi:2-polyprenyl-6-methoxyphenol hydroxylase-like FAD-dependent oxidoreductase
VVPVEANRSLVMLGGFHGEQAPKDPEGYEQYAHSLPNTAIADLLRDAEPLTDPVAYTYPASRRRHFERLRQIPAGYVAIGDTVCSFHPVYAQGMTVAALEAITLGECLDRREPTDAPMARNFYRRIATLVTSAWNMAVTADLAYTGTEGRKPRGFALAQFYQRRLILATHVSPEIGNTLVRVEHLISPGSVLLRPTTIAKVLWAARHARKALPLPAGHRRTPITTPAGTERG